MSSATARAEARRKAILSRGNDRLSKLTSSARGEGNPVYSHVDVPFRNAPTTETFVGEESIMPTLPARASPAPAPTITSMGNADDATGPSAWTTEQQQEFMRALMSAPGQGRAGPDFSRPFGAGQASLEPGAEAGDDPMAALMKALTGMTGQNSLGIEAAGANMSAAGTAQQYATPVTRSLFSRLRPLLHLLASWVLLAFFAFFMELKEYSDTSSSPVQSVWERWAELGWRSARKSFGVQSVPFFWAFVTLQLVLHSIQIFTKANPIQPPAWLAMALPVLPPQLRSIVTNVLTYVRMAGMLLDDIAGVVVGIGILIWISSWAASGQ